MKEKIVRIDRDNLSVIETLEDCIKQVKSGEIQVNKILILGEGEKYSLRKHNGLMLHQIVYMMESQKHSLLSDG